MSRNVQKTNVDEKEGGFWKYAIAAGVGAAAAGIAAYVVGYSDGKVDEQNASANSYSDCKMDKNHSCAVCLDQVEPVKVLNCGHSFHDGCIQQWLTQKATCPICRAKQ